MTIMKFRQVIDRTVLSTEERDARWELWRQGDLSWKLKGKQMDIYNDIIDQTKDVSVILSSRRIGKTSSALVAEIEVCLQHPDAIVKHACPTQKMVKKMMYPALKVLFHDAPPELELDKLWNASEGELRFPNGSIITIAGTDAGNADNLRGAYAHLVVADEAGFMDDLDYVVKSVLLPQTDTTGGRLILLSTPNFYNPQHEFHTEYVFPAEASGSLIKLNIYDSPMVDDKERQKIINRFAKKENDPKFLCEYMVEIPKTTESTVIPEFYPNRKEIIDPNMTVPLDPVDFYTGGDIGVRDLTCFLFSYYDFKTATLCVVDEWVANGMEMTTETIASAIKLKESTWYNNEIGNYVRPFKRVMDNDLKLITDLRVLHQLNFTATKKDNKVAQINQLRLLISEGRLRIHPRCKHLIYHVENCQWKDGKGVGNEFAHLTDSIDGDIKGGHADGLDALNYLVRNINFGHNPTPFTSIIVAENQHYANQNQDTPKTNFMKKIFGHKGKK